MTEAHSPHHLWMLIVNLLDKGVFLDRPDMTWANRLVGNQVVITGVGNDPAEPVVVKEAPEAAPLALPSAASAARPDAATEETPQAESAPPALP